MFLLHLEHVLHLDNASHLRRDLQNMFFILMVSVTVTPLFVILLEFAHYNIQL